MLLSMLKSMLRRRLDSPDARTFPGGLTTEGDTSMQRFARTFSSNFALSCQYSVFEINSVV